MPLSRHERKLLKTYQNQEIKCRKRAGKYAREGYPSLAAIARNEAENFAYLRSAMERKRDRA